MNEEGLQACPRPDKELVSGLGSGLLYWTQTAGQLLALKAASPTWMSHELYIPSRCMRNVDTGIECCHPNNHTNSLCPGLGSAEHDDSVVSYFWGTPTLVMYLQHPAGHVWHDGHGAHPAWANLQTNVEVGRKSVHRLPVAAACSSSCERVFSLFSHLPTWAGSLSCNTVLVWGGDAFQAAPAPAAWIRNLHSAWWMQLLLTQVSGWMFH